VLDSPTLRCLIAVLIFFAFSNNAFGEIALYPYKGSNEHVYTKPYSGHFRAINGDYHDASEYYKSERVELNATGLLLISRSPSTTLKLPWFIDLGYKSRLYSVDPVIEFGVLVVNVKENRTFEFGLDNLIKIGGKVSERPCVDSFNREFHCGTGLPWIDRPEVFQGKKITLSVSWRLTF